jgi:hypothetical protein
MKYSICHLAAHYLRRNRCVQKIQKFAFTNRSGQYRFKKQADHLAEHSIEAGSVVIAVGMKPSNDLALKFHDTADRFYIIGDCNVPGNIQKAMRSAFSIASTL